jgi:hypothetical protein
MRRDALYRASILGHSYANIQSFARLELDRSGNDQIRPIDWYYNEFDHLIQMADAKDAKVKRGMAMPIRAFQNQPITA